MVRAKLYLLEKRLGSYKCRCNRCQVCRSITETDMFICNSDQRSYKINRNEKCLIYLLTCNCYQKRYVGQTVDIFRNRWNNYKYNARKFDRGEDFMQKHLYEHFTLPGHSGFLHVSITLTDKTKREDYWIDILKTILKSTFWYFYFISYSFHCFYEYFCFIQFFFRRCTYYTIIPTSLFHIIVVTLAVL